MQIIHAGNSKSIWLMVKQVDRGSQNKLFFILQRNHARLHLQYLLSALGMFFL